MGNGFEVNEFLTERFKPAGYQLVRVKLPWFLAMVLGTCDPLMTRVSRCWGKYPKLDNSKMRRDLLPDLIDVKSSMIDSVYALVAVGRYERKPGLKIDKPEYQGTGRSHI